MFKKSEKSVKLNQYIRKEILSHLISNGCERKRYQKMLKKFKCDPIDIEKFVNSHAKDSQEGVKVECDSQALRSTNSWLIGFKESGLNLIGAKELSLITKIISTLNIPEAEECNGVDLKCLYEFISNVMVGDPSSEIDEKSRLFLCDILGELVDDINSAEGETRALLLRDDLMNTFSKETRNNLDCQTLQIGLNPLKLKFLNI